MRDRQDIRSERGAVIVMVAVWLPVLALFTSFAIDISHFFDYSRNLQNRADAAALAAGAQFGGICFGSPTSTQTDSIGEAAQQYSGPPTGTPDANLPYPYASVSTYYNQPNLTKGTPANYHVLLNSTKYWNQGGTDWSMGSDSAHQGSSLALCSSTDESGNTGPMADVKVTQANLGLFFPLLGITPDINAHARVNLESVGGENNIIPIAVRDPAETRCVEANFFNATTNSQIGPSVPLTKQGVDSATGAVQWDNSASPASVAIPSGANVYVQIVTGYCGANPQTYDSGSGILYVDSWSTASLPLASGAKPVITQGGVTLNGTCPPDNLSNQYFTDETCTVGVTANVAFAPGPGTTTVSATDTNTNQTIQLQNSPAGSNTWVTPAASGFTISPGSGQHLFDITTTQSNGNPCSGKGNKVGTCDLGVQAQTFGACDDGNATLTCTNPPNDSGPVVLAQLRLASDPAGSYGENAFGGGSTQQLVMRVEIAGLSNAKPGDPPTTLRFTESNNNIDHATGLINCGNGPSNTGGIAALMQGCPTAGTAACPVGSKYFSSCAPLAVNDRPVSNNQPCTPEGNDLSGTVVARGNDPNVPVDCTGTAPGNMPPVIQGLACRIYIAGCDKNGKALGTECLSNNWSPTEGAASIPADDPRALTMVITAPADLAANNSGQVIPIENFAVFYITGWSTQSATGCGSYASPPPGAAANAEVSNNCPDGSIPTNGPCSGVQKGMVWGFWMKYTDVGGIPSGNPCNTSGFGNCVPALTR